MEQFEPPCETYLTIDASLVNVLVHWGAAPVENYDGAEAIRRAAQVQVVDRNRPEWDAHHHIDMARAWLCTGTETKSSRTSTKPAACCPQKLAATPPYARSPHQADVRPVRSRLRRVGWHHSVAEDL